MARGFDALLRLRVGAHVGDMDDVEKPSDADLVAEMNHFRTAAIEQEVKTGERAPLTQDRVTDGLPDGIQRTRPSFPKDEEME